MQATLPVRWDCKKRGPRGALDDRRSHKGREHGRGEFYTDTNGMNGACPQLAKKHDHPFWCNPVFRYNIGSRGLLGIWSMPPVH